MDSITVKILNCLPANRRVIRGPLTPLPYARLIHQSIPQALPEPIGTTELVKLLVRTGISTIVTHFREECVKI